MKEYSVYIGGFQPFTHEQLAKTGVFIAHDFFGDDDVKREDYRNKFNIAFRGTPYMPVFAPNDSGTILETLTQSIVNCHAGIFDVTTNRRLNANVLIELGVCLALNHPAIVIAEGTDPLPDFLESLNPLRYIGRRDLIKQLPDLLGDRIAESQMLQHDYCVICRCANCDCRTSIPTEDKTYTLLGKHVDVDEVDIDVEEALIHFDLKRVQILTDSTLNLCEWLRLIKRVRFAFFYSKELGNAHHGDENAATMLQLGLAVGSPTPWRIIIPVGEFPPTDVSAFMAVVRNPNARIFQDRLSGAASKLLEEFNPLRVINTSILRPDIEEWLGDESNSTKTLDYSVPDGIAVLHNVPPFPSKFVTRPEVVDEIVSQLTSNYSTQESRHPTAIVGRNGSGKTNLAIAVSNEERVRRTYVDGIYWISSVENGKLLDAILALVQSISNESFVVETLAEASARLSELVRDQAVLIILDDVNVIRTEEIQAIVFPSSRSAYLLTSNNTEVMQQLDVSVIWLDRPTEVEAIRLLNEFEKFSKSANLDEVFAKAVELCHTIMGTNTGFTHLSLMEENYLTFVAAYPVQYFSQLTQSMGRINITELQSSRMGIIGRAFRKKENVITTDVAEMNDKYIDIALAPKIQSEIAVPLVYEGKVIGVLSSQHPERLKFTENYLHKLQRIAMTITDAIVASQRFDQQKRIQDMFDRINASTQSGIGLQEVVRTIKDLFDASFTIIRLINQNAASQEYVVTETFQYPIEFNPTSPRLRNGIGTTAQVIATRTLVVISDVETSSVVNPEVRFLGIKSMIIVPMRLDDLIIGVLYLYFENRRQFSEQEKADLQLIADKAARLVEGYETLQAPSQAKEPFVLVSYSYQDVMFVERLHDDLKAQGIPTWVDRKDIAVEENWTEQLREAIETCSAVILVISRDMINGGTTPADLELVLSLRKPLIPILIGEHNDVPQEILHLFYADMSGDNYTSRLSQVAEAAKWYLAGNTIQSFPKEKFVYMSYTPADTLLAQRLQGDLEDNEIMYWSEDNIMLGQDWHQVIDLAQQACSGGLVLISANSRNSVTGTKAIQENIKGFLNLKKQIFPVVLDNFKNLPQSLEHIQPADLRDYESGLPNLIRDLRQALSSNETIE